MGFNPLEWFKQHPASQQTVDVIAKPSRTNIVPSPGGKVGPTDGVSRIRTNQNVPGGGRMPLVRAGGLIQAATTDDPAQQALGGLTVVAPKVGMTLSIMDQVNRGMNELFGTEGPEFQGRGSGYRSFSAVKPSAPKPKSTMTTNKDGSRRSSDGGSVYSPDGKRVTTNGVTYDLATGQAVNPGTNKISPDGYSIDPKTGGRTDTATPAPTVKTNMADASELERYKVWVGANEGLARKVKPGQAGYEEIQAILGGKDGGASPEERLQFGPDVIAGAEDAGRTPEEMSQIMGDGLETVIDGNKETRITPTTPLTTSNPASPTDGASGLPDAADLERTFEIPVKDGGVTKITGQQMVDVGQSFARDYIDRVKRGDIKTPKPTETPATPQGAYAGVDINKIRISNADYNKMTGPLGDFIPQLKGLGTETTFDPVTKTWRILATTDRSGATKTYN